MLALAYAALWLFCFATPWQNIVVIPGLGTLTKLLGIVAVGMAVLTVLFTGRMRKLDTVHVLMVLFVVYVGFGAYRATYEELAVSKATTYVQLLFALWMIWELAPNPLQHRGLLFAYVSGAVVAAVATIMAFRRAGGGARFAAQGFDPNDLGMTLALGIPMAWYLGLVYKNPLLKWACRAYVPLAIVAVGLTASRGAFLATLAALTIVPLAMTRITPGRLVAGVFVLIASVAIAISYIPKQSWDRLGTTRAQVEEGTMNSRLLVWQAGLRAFIKEPVLGYGTGSFPETVSKQLGFRIQAHNTFLSVLVEQGIIGFAIFMSMLTVVFRRSRALPKLERRWAMVQLGTLMVALLPLGWEDAKPLWFILAVVTGMGAAAAAGRVEAPAPSPVRPGPRQHPAPARRPIIT